MSENTKELNKATEEGSGSNYSEPEVAGQNIEQLIQQAKLEPTPENAEKIFALTSVNPALEEALNFNGKPVYRFLKRSFDIAASAAGMIILSWLIVGTAVAVKVTSPGPIIFKQQRVGKNKRLFNIYKFRTMRIDTPDLPSHMIDANDWLTPIGALMRRLSLASVIIGTPGDGESTKSLSRSANSSLDLQLCERRPKFCFADNIHYKPFEFLSAGGFRVTLRALKRTAFIRRSVFGECCMRIVSFVERWLPLSRSEVIV